MKKLLTVVVAVLATSSVAQEIGTEITPVTPTSGNNTSNTSGNNTSSSGNTNANQNTGNQGTGTSTYKPKPREGEKTFEGTAVAAQSGAFGLRAGFGASGAVGIPVGNASVAAPTVGIAFMATDAFKLLIDLGAGLGLTNNVSYALGLNVGFDYLFRTPGDALRPFLHFAGSFTLSGSTGDPAIGFGAQLGFGAEYFFSPSFSVNGRLMLAVPMVVTGSGFGLAIVTVTPGVGATWYL